MLSLVRSHWFIVGLITVLTAALVAPEWAPRLGRGQDLLFAAMFLATGLTLPGSALRGALTNLRFHAWVQGISLVAFPLLGLGLDRTLALLGVDPHLRLGLLLTCCLPTTISSCVQLTRLAGGDEAAAICTAALGNLLGIVLTPFWALLLAGSHLEVEPWPVVRQLLLIIALPLAVGQALRPWLAAWATRHRTRLNTASTLALLTAMWGIFAAAFRGGVSGLTPVGLGILIVGICVLFLLVLGGAWTLFGRLGFPPAQRIAGAICSTQRTAAMGLPVLSVLLAGDPALGLCLAPLVTWHISQNVLTGLLTRRMQQTVNGATAPA
jgi:sodium/bile acid cotransporter 7